MAWDAGPRPSFGVELEWPNVGPNWLGQSVYWPCPPFYCSGVSVPAWAAAGRLLWWVEVGVLGVS